MDSFTTLFSFSSDSDSILSESSSLTSTSTSSSSSSATPFQSTYSTSSSSHPEDEETFGLGVDYERADHHDIHPPIHPHISLCKLAQVDLAADHILILILIDISPIRHPSSHSVLLVIFIIITILDSFFLFAH
ncbi:hypothetical protein D9758_013451 [Tetrapyrgos nigripes]|uniref:Uncharacterized protein n=1 Tax=Tetrapyrgos nigripes TaxID=182062 RepID=A0A8H5CT32_9AGAR|nr:hypothetical protein D9758_013451 [Tetrapyrgos nigripes]